MSLAIDFHAHAFPDALAARAVGALAEAADEKPRLNGTVAALLAAMDEHGVAISVVCSIATRPSQFDSILAWSRSIASARLIPFPSVHPSDPAAIERIHQLADEGFLGLKLHPYYQDFDVDELRMWPLYEVAAERGLLVALHCGQDGAFPGLDRAAPRRVAAVLDRLPELRLVTTHLGAWKQWDEVEGELVGRRVLMELSMSLDLLSAEQARRIILAHPRGYVLFGTDSPWRGHGETLAQLRALSLPAEIEDEVRIGNAMRVLDQLKGEG